jgi:hypothetical protein
LTCRYYGITRQTYDVWLRRYQEHGLEGLRERSSRPHGSPNATRAEVVGKIVYLRRSYHFGPHKISMYLRRYHDVEISPSGVRFRVRLAPGRRTCGWSSTTTTGRPGSWCARDLTLLERPLLGAKHGR